MQTHLIDMKNDNKVSIDIYDLNPVFNHKSVKYNKVGFKETKDTAVGTDLNA